MFVIKKHKENRERGEQKNRDILLFVPADDPPWKDGSRSFLLCQTIARNQQQQQQQQQKAILVQRITSLLPYEQQYRDNMAASVQKDLGKGRPIQCPKHGKLC
jgi:2C-methyl-D-erythritol 2,4-cyclodiphosphate synthase